jgi:hypothetical protein
MSLLDGIDNPEFLAAIEEQRVIAQRLADHYGWTLDQACEALLEDDLLAVKAFAVGNTIPRNWLH